MYSKIKKISNQVIAIHVLGFAYCKFITNRKTHKNFEGYLRQRLKHTYNKFFYMFLLSQDTARNDISAILNTWHCIKTAVKPSDFKERVYCTVFESAIAGRDPNTACDVRKFIDESSNYQQLADILIEIYFNKNLTADLDIIDIPQPYYLDYLYYMMLGMKSDSKHEIDDALKQFGIALKKVPDKIVDLTIIQNRLDALDHERYRL